MTHYNVIFHGEEETNYEVEASDRGEAVEKARKEHPKNAPMVKAARQVDH